MRRALVTLLAAGLAAVALPDPSAMDGSFFHGFLGRPALAQKKSPKKGGKKSKKAEEEERQAEEKALVERFRHEAPGFLRWWRSILEPRAQAKITLLDLSRLPQIRIHFSVLHVDENNILQEVLDQAALQKVVLEVAEGEQRRPKTVRATCQGEELTCSGTDPNDDSIDPEDVQWGGEILPMDKAGAPLDAVVVAAGHGGYEAVEQLEERHRSGVAAVLSKLGGAGARANAIWYGSMLHTYRTYEGFEGDLTRFDEAVSQCEKDRLKLKIESFAAKDEEKEQPKPKDPPCGLHKQVSRITSAIDQRAFRGKYGRLFGIDRRCKSPTDTNCIHPCSLNLVGSTAIQHVDLDDVEDPTADTGAFEEALRLMLKYGAPGHRKVIIVLSDGRDGYLDDDAACRQYFTENDNFCALAADKAVKQHGRKALNEKYGKVLRSKEEPVTNAGVDREVIQACVQDHLDRRATLYQEAFRESARPWLAVLVAAGIRVFVVTYAMVRDDGTPVSYPYERERLELLAHKTGGTYREVYKAADVVSAAEAVVAEIQGERVLALDARLASETAYKLRLKLEVKLAGDEEVIKLETGIVEIVTPFKGEGFWFFAKQMNQRLKLKVGTILYWVIVVVAVILVLVLMYLVFKLFKALVMKIVKAIAKKGTDAAKGAAKGK